MKHHINILYATNGLTVKGIGQNGNKQKLCGYKSRHILKLLEEPKSAKNQPVVVVNG